MIRRYSDIEIQFLKDNYKEMGNKELASNLDNRSADSVKHQLKRFNLKRSKEQVTKLRKAKNAGQFKPGSVPHNTKYDGYERLTKDGYVEVRTSKGNFELKHRLLWSEKFGEIPEDHIVVFKSGRPSDFTIDDLELISMADNMRRNHNPKKTSISLKKKWNTYWHLNQLGIRKGWFHTMHYNKLKTDQQ